MKRKKINKTVIAWLLAAAFAFPFVARNVHIYLENCEGGRCAHAESGRPEGHDCNTCPVCQFTLSFFTGTENFPADRPAISCSKPAPAFRQDKKYKSPLSAHHLRAPPSPRPNTAG